MPGLHRAVPAGLGEALWLFLTLRIILSVFVLMLSVLGQAAPPCAGGMAASVMHTTGLDFRLFGTWERWDACWYERIAVFGYQPGDISVNFFPLYPALMWAISVLVGGHLTLSGLIVSGVAYMGAMAGLYRLVRLDFAEEVAERSMLYLSVFPAAFFLFAPFTEALFLAVAIWALYRARCGMWWSAGRFALLGGLTRTQGSLLAIPLAWECICQWRAGRCSLRVAIVPLLAPAGYALFTLYARVHVGLTPYQTQTGGGGAPWRNVPETPWAIIFDSWHHIRAYSDVIELLNLSLLMVFTILLVVGLRRLPFLYTLYAVPQLLLIGSLHRSGTPLLASARYLLVIFPVFIFLARLGGYRRFHYSWLIVSLLGLALLLSAFVGGALVP